VLVCTVSVALGFTGRSSTRLTVRVSAVPVPVEQASAFRRTVWPVVPTARLSCVPAAIRLFALALSTVTERVCGAIVPEMWTSRHLSAAFPACVPFSASANDAQTPAVKTANRIVNFSFIVPSRGFAR
jgi:CBS domain containing-hemolysin-like protein